MWIGGGSQSTAGGIKVNAFAVVVLNLVAVLRGTERVEVFGRELSYDSIRRSNATVVMSFGVLFIFIFVISILEPKLSLLTIAFECVSAISTVGSSLNATPLLGGRQQTAGGAPNVCGACRADNLDARHHQAERSIRNTGIRADRLLLTDLWFMIP